MTRRALDDRQWRGCGAGHRSLAGRAIDPGALDRRCAGTAAHAVAAHLNLTPRSFEPADGSLSRAVADEDRRRAGRPTPLPNRAPSSKNGACRLRVLPAPSARFRTIESRGAREAPLRASCMVERGRARARARARLRSEFRDRALARALRRVVFDAGVGPQLGLRWLCRRHRARELHPHVEQHGFPGSELDGAAFGRCLRVLESNVVEARR
jgi:hypothetical protein